MVLKLKICFLALDAYPILTDKNLGSAGGAEVEQVSLAHELVNLGIDVSMVTYNYGLDCSKEVDGIEIFPTYSRSLHKKLTVFAKQALIWRALLKTKANLFFYEAGAVGVLPLFCFLNRKKYIYRVPSDAKVTGKSSLIEYWDMKRTIADEIEIKRANVVISQNSLQKETLKERFGIESPIIKNGLSLPPQLPKEPSSPTILWVGSLSRVKQPFLFLDLAKAMPSVHFEMVGGKGSPLQLYDEISAEAKSLPNLKFHGFVPFNKINQFFEKAAILVSTSAMEGFPNTFIQAWANSMPVVSLKVNPDGLFESQKCGFVSGSFNQLVSDITSLLERPSLLQTMGNNGRKYVVQDHDIKKIAKEYIAIFESL
jgi:glycosyltransferase involved in cell wall biosynthesis